VWSVVERVSVVSVVSVVERVSVKWRTASSHLGQQKDQRSN
jgi:hypothetical protein